MYPSPFCNLSRRRWMGGGVQVGCGAGGTPPPDTETPRQPPGHFGRRPNWANAAGEPPARFQGTLRPTPALGPAPGGDRCRRSPRQTRNPPLDTETPASLPGTLRDGPTGQTPPGNPPPDSGALCVRPLPSGRRRVVIQLSASGLYVDLKRSLIVVHLGQNPFQLVGYRQHGLVLAGKYLLVVREQHHLHHRVVLVLAEQYAYDRVLVN